jgi:large subunit ribosomal protein L18
MAKEGNKTEMAKKVWTEMAKKAQDLKIESIVFDRGWFAYHGRVKALAEALREGGLKF